jgi:CheY-like chemotaxis protein
MYKIAIVDDDERWCFAVKSFFRKSFEITTFKHIPYSLYELVDYDLVIVNYSIPTIGTYETNIQEFEVVRFLKTHCMNPPLLIIVSEAIGKHNSGLLQGICPEADAFFAKAAGLEELLQETQQLLAAKNKKLFERSNQAIYGSKPMYTIAVIDDDKHWCYAIDRFFRNEFEVYTFPTTTDFLKQSFDFDLVLVDYSIPHIYYEDHMDSRELIRYLKSLRYPPLVVLVSGYVSKNDSALGKTICPEADAFFAKDAGLDELLMKLKELLACKR